MAGADPGPENTQAHETGKADNSAWHVLLYIASALICEAGCVVLLCTASALLCEARCIAAISAWGCSARVALGFVVLCVSHVLGGNCIQCAA